MGGKSVQQFTGTKEFASGRSVYTSCLRGPVSVSVLRNLVTGFQGEAFRQGGGRGGRMGGTGKWQQDRGSGSREGGGVSKLGKDISLLKST